MLQILKKSAGAVPALASGRPGSTEKWFNSDGELNASDNTDVIRQFASLMSEVAAGRVKFEDPDMKETASVQMTAAERTQVLVEAFYDRSTAAWAETGATIGAVLYQTAIREGFMRRFLQKGDVQQGAIPRFQVRFPNTQAVVASEATVVAPQLATQRYIFPPEYYIQGNVRVEERDIAQGAADIMDSTYHFAM